MRLEERADQLDVVWIADDDRVRVADRDRGHVEPRYALALVDRDLSHVLLDEPVREHTGDDLARADANTDALGAGALGQPTGCDPRPVA